MIGIRHAVSTTIIFTYDVLSPILIINRILGCNYKRWIQHYAMFKCIICLLYICMNTSYKIYLKTGIDTIQDKLIFEYHNNNLIAIVLYFNPSI